MNNNSSFKISIEDYNYDYELNQIIDTTRSFNHENQNSTSKLLHFLITKSINVSSINQNFSNESISVTRKFELAAVFGPNAFTVFMILFYGAFLTLVLYMNVKPSKKTTMEGLVLNRINNEYLMNSIRQQIDIKSNKNLLEELKNKEFRKKAWEIYRSEKKLNLKNEENILKDIDKKLVNILKSSDQFDESDLNSSLNKLKDTKKSSNLNEIINSEDENRNLLNVPDNDRISPEYMFKYGKMKSYSNDLIESNNNCYYTISGNSMQKFIMNDKLDQSTSSDNHNCSSSNNLRQIPLIVITDTNEDPFNYRKSSINSSISDKKSSFSTNSSSFSDKFIYVQRF